MSTDRLEKTPTSLTKADEKMVQTPKERISKPKKMPNAKYLRTYTQKLITEKLIPHLSELEQEEVKFAQAVHKVVVYYMDRKGIS